MVNTTTELVRTKNGDIVPHSGNIGDDPEVIRAQIKRTRAEMGRTLDEIQVRLSPDYIKQQAQDSIKEATVEKVEQMAQTATYKVNNWRSNAIQTVKDNPVPAALIGIGIGWMLLSDNNNRDDYEYDYAERYYGSRGERPSTGYYNYNYNRAPDYESREPGMVSEMQSRVSETAENAREWVDEKRDQVQQSAENAAERVQHQAAATSEAVRENINEATARAQEYVSETAEQARERAEEMRMQAEQKAMQVQRQAQRQARRVKRSFWQMMEENPLAVGIAAAAAGALVGLAIPTTQKENELMGETRDRLMEEVTTTAERTLDKAQTVAERATKTAVAEVRQEADKQNMPTPPPTKKPTPASARPSA